MKATNPQRIHNENNESTTNLQRINNESIKKSLAVCERSESFEHIQNIR